MAHYTWSSLICLGRLPSVLLGSFGACPSYSPFAPPIPLGWGHRGVPPRQAFCVNVENLSWDPYACETSTFSTKASSYPQRKLELKELEGTLSRQARTWTSLELARMQIYKEKWVLSLAKRVKLCGCPSKDLDAFGVQALLWGEKSTLDGIKQGDKQVSSFVWFPLLPTSPIRLPQRLACVPWRLRIQRRLIWHQLWVSSSDYWGLRNEARAMGQQQTDTGNVAGQDAPHNYRNLKHGLNAKRTYTCRQKAMSSHMI